MSSSPEIIFVIHQIGAGADGGVQSIGELLAATPQLQKLIITNLDTPASRRWAKYGQVEIWPDLENANPSQASRIYYRFRQIVSRLRNNLKIATRVISTGARVVHCNDHRSFWSSVIGAKLSGARVILNVRDTMMPGARSHAIWRSALRLCDRFLVLSKEMVDSWKKTLEPLSHEAKQAAKFDYIYSIVDQRTFYPVSDSKRSAIRAELGISSDQLVIIVVGRVESKKAQLHLIGKTIEPVIVKVPEAHFYFVGDYAPETNSYASACAAAVEDKGLQDAVSFVGYSARTADWYRACDLLLLASQREGLPRCVIESLSCGASIVSFDVCSVREILEENDCGFVVSHGDYAGLVDSALSLLRNGAFRERVRASGPALSQRLFRADVNAQQYVELVSKLGGN